jgi:outer membrane protein assembly factor BamB
LYVLARANPGTRLEGERVVCADANTGRILWQYRFNVTLSDVPDSRVGWSSVVGDPETGNVYALGVCGLFLCLEGESGEVRWSIPMSEQFGLLSTYGGRTNFPIVCEDLVIVSGVTIGWGEYARPCHRFIALDKRSGDVVWVSGTRELPEDTTYSAPALTTLAGQKALVVGAGDGTIWAFQPRTGKTIWYFRFSRRGLNVPVLATHDRVYMGHAEENIEGTEMGAVTACDATGSGDITDTGRLWLKQGLMLGCAAPLLVDKRLYLVDDRAKLHILDADSGQEVAKKTPLGTFMRGSPLYADGKIYVVTTSGRWYIFRPDPQQGVQSVSKGRLLAGEECQASPICANGRIYLRTSDRLLCLANPRQQPSVQPPQSPPDESALVDHQPAWLQLVPAEMLLRPGERKKLAARVYNARGQFLRDVHPQLTLEGPGTIEQGAYVVPGDATHSAAYIVAKADGLQARSRVRIVPNLPWKFDFEDVRLSPQTGMGDPPVTWVGCRYRHVIRKVDGKQVMVKITTIPKGTRSQGWFGHSDLSNYTIQANVRGAQQDGGVPDIGVIAQGYALIMHGNNQKLQIRSWASVLNNATEMDFSWQPDTWYTVKLRAAVEGSHAVLKGKVWRQTEPEPESWTVELKDPAPNRTGSPGLFGNATEAEIFLDNIQVYPNDATAGLPR